MRIKAAHNCEALAQTAFKFLKNGDPDFQSQTADMTLNIGLASDPAYKVPAHAKDAIYVGDSAHVGQLLASTELRAEFAKDKNAVSLLPKYNSASGKWDMVARKNFVGDAAPDYLAGQAIAPWSQSFFKDIYERPLLYSHASDLVKMDQGSNPWCETMNLVMADYAGSAIGPLNAGSPDGNNTKDIQAKSGIMVAPVINMFVTYTLTMEELEGAKMGN